MSEFNANLNTTQYEMVYYVYSDNRLFNPIAIRPQIAGKTITWGDTSRGTYLEIKEIELIPEAEKLPVAEENPPREIVIITPDGSRIKLVKLTKDVYEQYVRERVAGKPEFESDDAVQQYYLKTNFDVY